MVLLCLAPDSMAQSSGCSAEFRQAYNAHSIMEMQEHKIASQRLIDPKEQIGTAQLMCMQDFIQGAADAISPTFSTDTSWLNKIVPFYTSAPGSATLVHELGAGFMSNVFDQAVTSSIGNFFSGNFGSSFLSQIGLNLGSGTGMCDSMEQAWNYVKNANVNQGDLFPDYIALITHDPRSGSDVIGQSGITPGLVETAFSANNPASGYARPPAVRTGILNKSGDCTTIRTGLVTTVTVAPDGRIGEVKQYEDAFCATMDCSYSLEGNYDSGRGRCVKN